jgi:putative peptidoglycan lipid II flippase
MSKRFTSTIAGASIFISVLMIIGKGFGFLREIIYAGYFGIGKEFDLYLVSAVLPVTINVIIFFLGQNYFIPSYNKIVNLKTSDAPKFSVQIFWLFIIGGIALSILLLLLSEYIINLYLYLSRDEIQATATKIFRIFLITIPLSAGISILSSYLQAKFEFRYPAISNLFLNLSIIILILLFTESMGIYIIPIGYTIGTFIQFYYLLNKSAKFNELKFNEFRFNLTYFGIIGSSLIMVILIESIGQLYMIVDRFFYNQVDIGGIAALNYALSLYHLPIAVFSFALSTAIFPKISDALARSAVNELNKILNDSINVSIIIFIPITLLFIFYGDTIIKLIFERGNFTIKGTFMTFEVIRIYAISLVFYTSYAILNKLFYSSGMLKSLLVITIIGVILKIFLNFIFVKSLHQNGLALSSSLSYLLFFVVSFVYLSRKLSLSGIPFFYSELLLNLCNGIISYLLTGLIVYILSPLITYHTIISIFLFNIIYFFNLYKIDHSFIQIIKNVTHQFQIKSKFSEV